MKKVLLVMIIALLLIGCSATPEEMALTIDLGDWEYLTPDQQNEVQELVDGFNEQVPNYYMWTDSYISNEGAENFNSLLEESGRIGIFFDICGDGSLFVLSSWSVAGAIAEDINNMNTNAFSRAMFFVDECAKNTTGNIITKYNIDKDVLK